MALRLALVEARNAAPAPEQLIVRVAAGVAPPPDTEQWSARPRHPGRIGAAQQRADLKALLQSSAARSAFVKSVERIDAVAGDKVLLLAAPVIFDEWLRWVETLQREFGVRLDACKIDSLDQPGLVRIEATFVSASQLPSAKSR